MDNDLIALNPSVSRRHAAIVILKGGTILLIDLKSKAKTFKNSVPVEFDHVGVQLQTNDIFSVGTSTRHYLLEIDNTSVVDYLQRKSRDINREINQLSDEVTNAQGEKTKSTTKVFLGGLSYSTSRYEIVEFFMDCGQMVSLVLPQLDRSIPSDSEGAYAVRGIAFIEFAEEEFAKKAISFSGRFLNGRPLLVNAAHLTRGDRAQANKEESEDIGFVAATDATFDHPTHGTLKAMPEVDPATGELLSGGKFHHHDDRGDVDYSKTRTNAHAQNQYHPAHENLRQDSGNQDYERDRRDGRDRGGDRDRRDRGDRDNRDKRSRKHRHSRSRSNSR